MKKFELTIPAFEGKVTYGFDDSTDYLVMIDMSSLSFSPELWRFLWKKLPATSRDVFAMKGQTGVITEIVENITFDMFWQRYNDKARSSKVKTERVWSRMNRTEQVKAYQFIPRYFESIPQGVCKKYATTYLNDQLWNN